MNRIYILVSLPVYPQLLDAAGEHMSIFLAGQTALVMILLGIKVMNLKHRRGKGKGRNLQDTQKKGSLGSVLTCRTFFFVILVYQYCLP